MELFSIRIQRTFQLVSTSSRVCFGVFLYENAAIDAAKENGLYTNESEVDIIECELGKFEEL